MAANPGALLATMRSVRESGSVHSRAPREDMVQIEFNDHSAQYALLQSTFDKVTPRNASLKLSVRSSDQMTERLNLNGTGIGFFGASPAAKPTVRGSRQNGDALVSLIAALATLGLVTDNTSG